MPAVDGVHDLGGMEDFGAVARESDEPVFHAPWEGRVFAIGGIITAQGLASTNSVRHAIERMDPAHYLGSPYYEHWLTAFATLLVERGVLTSEELDARSGGPFQLSRASQAPPWKPGAPQRARFALHQLVRVREIAPRGHTRCPRYVRGKRGTVERCDGSFKLPDADAHGADAPVEATYSVRFEALELWGESAQADASVSVDLWESYLQAA
jgi:nitrile hydratase subunit beta